MNAVRVATLGCCLASLVACSTVEGEQRSSLANMGLFQDVGARAARKDKAGDGPLAVSILNSAQENSAQGSSGEDPGRAARDPGFKSVAYVDDAAATEAPASGGGSYRLNFENADIRQVVQAVLGETLKLNYTLAEDVTGKVTISSPRPMSALELLSALEASLNASGFAMTKTAGGYRIGATAIGGGVIDTPFDTQPGYGVSVVPLRHVSAATMGRLVAGFVAEGEGLRVDASRNAMVVRGSGVKRQEAVQTILSFDADWMQNQAVGIYEIRRAQPEAVVSELNRVFDSEGGGGAKGVIQFKPIGRLRSVMVVTKNPELLKRAETWVRRLDRDTASGADNVFVYKARYRDARELARIVTSLFRAGGDGARGAPATTDTRSSGVNRTSLSSEGGGSGAGGGSLGSSSQGANSSAAALSGRSSTGSAFNNPNFDPPQGQGDSAQAEGQGQADAPDLNVQATGERSNILVSADPANNAVVVSSDGYTYQKILSMLRQLDNAPLQVAIQATIAEVQLNDNISQGVEYFVKSKNIGLGNDKGSVSLFGEAASVLQKTIPGFNVLLGSNVNPDVIISALDQITNVEILSSPSLVVAENQPANFQVGNEVPITVRQAQSVDNVDAPLVNQVEFKDTGVILNVTPRIGTNDAVTMQIEQEISAVVSGDSSLTPTISKRRVASNISVNSGQTVLLAGLISKRDERGRNGIPVLGDLPGLGALFRQKSDTKQRTELVLFIKPTVIRNGEDAASVANEFRSRLLVNNAANAKPVPTK